MYSLWTRKTQLSAMYYLQTQQWKRWYTFGVFATPMSALIFYLLYSVHPPQTIWQILSSGKTVIGSKIPASAVQCNCIHLTVAVDRTESSQVTVPMTALPWKVMHLPILCQFPEPSHKQEAVFTGCRVMPALSWLKTALRNYLMMM